MINFDPSLYTIEIKRISTDQGLLYEAKVKEIPGVAGYSECAADAFDEARDALEMLHDLAQAQGREFPPPLPSTDSTYNGRITLRMSSSLHRRASLLADLQGVSLNALVVEALSEKVFSFKNRTQDDYSDYSSYTTDTTLNNITKKDPSSVATQGAITESSV